MHKDETPVAAKLEQSMAAVCEECSIFMDWVSQFQRSIAGIYKREILPLLDKGDPIPGLTEEQIQAIISGCTNAGISDELLPALIMFMIDRVRSDIRAELDKQSTTP
jgi:hypothetical protein